MEGEHCPCKRKRCPRWGDCEACREHHRQSKHAAACEREKKSELKGSGEKA